MTDNQDVRDSPLTDYPPEVIPLLLERRGLCNIFVDLVRNRLRDFRGMAPPLRKFRSVTGFVLTKFSGFSVLPADFRHDLLLIIRLLIAVAEVGWVAYYLLQMVGQS